MPGIAAATIVAGALGNAIFLGSIVFATDEVLVGAGLIAAGVACQALERREQ
jgi:ABC-type proline/glycine betaine transport system permease subunit